jgi:hypothetical protein
MAFSAASVTKCVREAARLPRPGGEYERLALRGHRPSRAYRGLPARRIVRQGSKTGTRVDRIEWMKKLLVNTRRTAARLRECRSGRRLAEQIVKLSLCNGRGLPSTGTSGQLEGAGLSSADARGQPALGYPCKGRLFSLIIGVRITGPRRDWFRNNL